MDILAVIIVATLFILYFLPVLVSWSRGCTQWIVIAILNILLWWTVLFWIIALIMAMTWETLKDKELKELQLKQLRK